MSLRNIARNQIQKYGQKFTITRDTLPTYDPATQSVTTGTPTSYQVYGWYDPFSYDEIDNSLILVGDLRLWVESNGSYVPQEGDSIAYGASQYRVINHMVYGEVDNDAVYVVHARGFVQ